MTADDIVALMIPATWFALMAAEAAKPARSWPKMRLWRSRSMVFFTSGSTRWLAQSSVMSARSTACSNTPT